LIDFRKLLFFHLFPNLGEKTNTMKHAFGNIIKAIEQIIFQINAPIPACLLGFID